MISILIVFIFNITLITAKQSQSCGSRDSLTTCLVKDECCWVEGTLYNIKFSGCTEPLNQDNIATWCTKLQEDKYKEWNDVGVC